MLGFLIYDAKVAVLIAVFYMFYRLMLARETFHRVNRIVLLLTAVASFVLPLCVITFHETVVMPMPQVSVGDLQVASVEVSDDTEPLWQTLLPMVFMIGMLATLGHTLLSMFRILMLIKRSEKHPQEDGTVICVSGNANLSPFSWMHYIVMNQSDYAEQNAAVLAHERGHIRLRHSWDLLLVDTLTALQWFNPAMWMLRSDLRALHEYEADGAVLSLGINARQYQYLLITKAAGIGGYSLANGISHSTLKDRINMMLHKKSNQTSLLKLLALVPIVGLALAVNAEKVQDVVYTDASEVSETVSIEQEQILPEATAEAVSQPEEMLADDEKVIIKVHVSAKEDGSPIVGAIAQVAGTKKGSVTDFSGNLTLEANIGSKVEVSYIGYDTKILTVKKDAVLQEYEVVLAKEPLGGKAYDVVDEMPEFPGGPQALLEYLMKNIRYPKEAEDVCVQGRVIVQFVVDKDGTIKDAHIVKSVYPALDEEALRVVNSMPKWIPGKQNGEAVSVKYTIPVSFIQSAQESDNAEVTVRKVEGYAVAADETLFILDGKPIPSEQVKEIDPKTIDHMEVLKDQPAIEKYGEKAKNGVVVITTKKK